MRWGPLPGGTGAKDILTSTSSTSRELLFVGWGDGWDGMGVSQGQDRRRLPRMRTGHTTKRERRRQDEIPSDLV